LGGGGRKDGMSKSIRREIPQDDILMGWSGTGGAMGDGSVAFNKGDLTKREKEETRRDETKRRLLPVSFQASTIKIQEDLRLIDSPKLSALDSPPQKSYSPSLPTPSTPSVSLPTSPSSALLLPRSPTQPSLSSRTPPQYPPTHPSADAHRTTDSPPTNQTPALPSWDPSCAVGVSSSLRRQRRRVCWSSEGRVEYRGA